MKPDGFTGVTVEGAGPGVGAGAGVGVSRVRPVAAIGWSGTKVAVVRTAGPTTGLLGTAPGPAGASARGAELDGGAKAFTTLGAGAASGAEAVLPVAGVVTLTAAL